MSRPPETPDVAGPDRTPVGSPWTHHDLLFSFIIVATVLILGCPGITTGGLGWSDASNHTFDGIFVLEYAKACLGDGRLLFEPDTARQWAEQFYLRHPALGIIVYWPPGFAAVEAAAFAIFGVSIATARLTVLLFAAGACLLMYSLGKRWFDRPTGLFAALLLVSCPHGALWLNDVMLEWPALFWILAAVSAYQAARDTLNPRWIIALSGAIVMAFFTKQTAGLVLPVILLHAMIAENRRRILLRPAFLVSTGLAAVIIAGYVVLARPYTALPAELLRPSFDLSQVAHWPPEILGWPLLPVVLLGLATFIIERDRGARGLLLLWFAAWAALGLCVTAKEPRYLFFSLPPLAFGAVRFFVPASTPGRAERRLALRADTPRIALLAVLVVVQTVLARTKSTGRLPDYAPAVSALADRPDADLVLIDAVRDGQFVFDVYTNSNARDKIIPLRASKVLYARAARMRYSSQLLVKNEQDIIDLMHRYGIRYVVIESELPRTHYVEADPPARRLLRHLLTTDPRFQLVQAWPLRCGDPAWDDVELRLYVYPDCPPRTSNTITIPFPGMAREVVFRLP